STQARQSQLWSPAAAAALTSLCSPFGVSAERGACSFAFSAVAHRVIAPNADGASVNSPSTSFFFYCYCDHRALHSFPTRRSSDLARSITGGGAPGEPGPGASIVLPGEEDNTPSPNAPITSRARAEISGTGSSVNGMMHLTARREIGRAHV